MNFKETTPTTIIKIPEQITAANYKKIHAKVEGCGDIINEEMCRNQNDILYYVRAQGHNVKAAKSELEQEFKTNEYVVTMQQKIKELKDLEEQMTATGWLIKNRIGAYEEVEANKEYKAQKKALEDNEPYYPKARFHSDQLKLPTPEWVIDQVYDAAQIPVSFHCTDPQGVDGERESHKFQDNHKNITHLCSKVRKRLVHFANKYDGLEDVPGVTFRKKVTCHYTPVKVQQAAMDKHKKQQAEAIERVTGARQQTKKNIVKILKEPEAK